MLVTIDIKLEDVQLSRGSDLPYFGHIEQFCKWLAAQPIKKNFAEWNDRIYFTTELINRNFTFHKPVCILDDIQ